MKYSISRNVMTGCTDLTVRAIHWLTSQGVYSSPITLDRKDQIMRDLVSKFGVEVLDTITATRV